MVHSFLDWPEMSEFLSPKGRGKGGVGSQWTEERGSMWGCAQNGGYQFDPCIIPNDFGP